MENKLNKLKIANFFGEEAQIDKLEEEIWETIEAFCIFLESPTLKNMIKLNNEIRDQLNVGDGLILKLGGNIQEQEVKASMQINRTIKIINDIPSNTKDKVKAYEDRRKHY